jgi:hypothetical protein
MTGLSRRRFVKVAAVMPVLLAVEAKSKQVCYDPKTSSWAEQNQRKSLNFQLVSSDPQKVCGGCSYFTANKAGTCGACRMLNGGSVSPQSSCDFWVKRKAAANTGT